MPDYGVLFPELAAAVDASTLFKKCLMCGEPKPLAEFSVKSNLPSGINTRCRDCVCQAEYLRRWGITYEELQVIYGTVCNLCDREETVIDSRSGRLHRLCIDHDHRCCKNGCRDCIRGLLCRTCNYQLGVLEARPDWLRKALEYLGRDSSWVVD